MQFDHISGACGPVQSVHVLGDDRQFGQALPQFHQGVISGVGLYGA